MNAAQKQRAYRARQRRGETCYRVAAGHNLLHTLIDQGALAEADADDPGKVAKVLTKMLADYAVAYQRNRDR